MRIKAKLVHKYQEQSGVSQNTGNSWRRQEMKFQVLKDDWTEGNESIVVSCTNALILDAPVLKEGAVGILSVWCNAEEYNGRCYNRMNMNGWTPQSEAGAHVAQEQKEDASAPQFTPEQMAYLQQQKGKGGLPF